MERPDHIYIISLKRANRTGDAIKALAAQGVHDAEVMYAMDCLDETSPAFGLKGYAASALTHQMVYNDIIDKGYYRALILEDDALFEGDFFEQLARIDEPKDWQMFYFGGTRVNPIEKYIGNGNVQIDKTLCGHAYMIRWDALREAIKMIPQRPTEPHDLYLCELQKKYPTYISIPFLILQTPGHSSIENRWMDYTEFMRTESNQIKNNAI